MIHPFSYKRSALRTIDRFKQAVKDIPIIGPIIKDRYQKTKRDVKMAYYRKDDKEKIPVINHFV